MFAIMVCEFLRVVKNADFSLLLKTDDDCYINMDEILMNIDHKSLMRSNLWWGKWVHWLFDTNAKYVYNGPQSFLNGKQKFL